MNRWSDVLDEPDSSELLARANSAYNENDAKLAADFYQQYLDVRPNENDVKLLLTNAMVDAEEYSAANEVLSELKSWADTALPDSAKSNFYFNRANVAAALGEHQEAVKNYSKSLELEFQTSTIFNRANSLSSLGRYAEAIAEYDECEGYAAAMFNAGNAQAAMLELEDALACFNAAVQLAPHNESFESNRQAVLQTLALVEGHQYEKERIDSAGFNMPIIMIRIQLEESVPVPSPQWIPLIGNVGNQGNTGYLNVRGGQGFDGKTGGAIGVTFISMQPSQGRSDL